MRQYLIVSGVCFVGAAASLLDNILVTQDNNGVVASAVCPINGEISCRNKTVQRDLCCFEAPGGLLMHTQFWTYSPGSGPADSWTVHGLWPDYCNGDFPESCDPDRAVSSPISLLTTSGNTALLREMQIYWKNLPHKTDESFWKHEWDKHGTCMSTLGPRCMPPGSKRGDDAIAYWKKVMQIFRNYPTYKWLADEGIVPSNTARYNLKDLDDAIIKATPGNVTAQFNCENRNELQHVSYYFNLQGSVTDGKFIPIPPFDPHGSHPKRCPDTGIKYLPKRFQGGNPQPVPSDPTPTTGPVPPGDRYHIEVQLVSSGNKAGNLLSMGKWGISTPARYTAVQTDAGFTLKTSKGLCEIDDGQLTCGPNVGAGTIFTQASSGDDTLLAYKGSTSFSANRVPRGNQQEVVFVGEEMQQRIALVMRAVARDE